MPLNAKQRIFIREYLKDRNRKRAYRASYGETVGAEKAAHRLLKNVEVSKAVEKGLARLEAKLDVDAERVLKEISELAFQTKKIAHSNKLKALELIGKHFKMFTDVHEHAGKDGGPFAIIALPANGSESEEFGKTAETESKEEG